MNIPARYMVCVVVTAVMAVIGYVMISDHVALGIAIGGLITPFFVHTATTSHHALNAVPAAAFAAQAVRATSTNAASSGSSQPEEEGKEVSYTPFVRPEYDGEVKTIYVGNLPYRANEAAIRKLFSDYGLVLSVRLVKDRETGKRRGYGFVEMPAEQALSAIDSLNEAEYLQRTLKVREANEKKDLTKPEDESALSAEL